MKRALLIAGVLLMYGANAFADCDASGVEASGGYFGCVAGPGSEEYEQLWYECKGSVASCPGNAVIEILNGHDSCVSNYPAGVCPDCAASCSTFNAINGICNASSCGGSTPVCQDGACVADAPVTPTPPVASGAHGTLGMSGTTVGAQPTYTIAGSNPNCAINWTATLNGQAAFIGPNGSTDGHGNASIVGNAWISSNAGAWNVQVDICGDSMSTSFNVNPGTVVTSSSPVVVTAGPPPAPIDVTLTNPTTATLTLNWVQPYSTYTISGFNFFVATDSDFTQYVLAGSAGASQRSVVLPGSNTGLLTPGTTYYARLQAIDSMGRLSALSQTASAAILAASSVPSGRLIVKFTTSGAVALASPTGSPRMTALSQRYNVRSSNSLFKRVPSNAKDLGRIYLIDVPYGVSLEQAAKDYAADRDDVEFAEPDYAVPATRIPNDFGYKNQWAPDAINLPAAWDITTGSSTESIAILDDGIDVTQPDLMPNILPGYNVLDGSDDVSETESSHGTAVAGVAAALGDNHNGIAGVAWSSKIRPIKITENAAYAYCSNMVTGIAWAADQGIKVENLSYQIMGPQGCPNTINAAAEYAQLKGTLIFVGAGNTAEDISIYCPAIKYFVLVGATNGSNKLASFSSYGACLDFVAPGDNIMITVPSGEDKWDSGTSYASPMAAGVASLIYSVNPSFTPQQVLQVMASTAYDLGAPGRDNTFGYGLINAGGALGVSNPSRVAPPIFTPNGGPFVSSTTIFLRSASLLAAPVKTYYTLDGSTPTLDSTLYERPIYLTEGAFLRAVTFVDGVSPSVEANALFTSVLPAPANLRLLNIRETGTEFTIVWDSACTGYLCQYQLDMALDPDFTSFVPGYKNFMTSVSTSTFQRLALDTRYYIRVRTYRDSNTFSAYTNILMVQTPKSSTLSFGIAAHGLVPASVPVNSADFYLQVTGFGFESGAVVQWNGVDLPTVTLVPGGVLFAKVLAANLTSAGTALITVKNPSTLISSDAVLFSIIGPPPTINAVTDPRYNLFSTAVSGSGDFYVVLWGTHFINGINNNTVTFGAQPLTVSYAGCINDLCQINALVSNSPEHPQSPQDNAITIQNVSGVSNTYAFTITPAAAPNASTLNGATYPSAGTLSIPASGTDATYNWKVLSSNGDVVAQSTTPSPDLKLSQFSLPSGSYQVNIQSVSKGIPSAWASVRITVASPSNFSAARIFPNPWRSTQGANSVTFDHLPNGSTVKIFTIAGQWVKTLNASSDAAHWDLATDSGDKAASGLYLYLITDNQGNKTRGKLTVIR